MHNFQDNFHGYHGSFHMPSGKLLVNFVQRIGNLSRRSPTIYSVNRNNTVSIIVFSIRECLAEIVLITSRNEVGTKLYFHRRL